MKMVLPVDGPLDAVQTLARSGCTNVTARKLFPSGVAHVVKGVRS